MTEILLGVVGVLIGGAITLIVARIYYQRASDDLQRASDDLKDETTKIRDMIKVLARALEAQGLVKLAWDAEGELSEITYVTAHDTGTISISEHLSVSKQEP